MSCCGKPHPWDIYEVALRWRPATLRCLTVGENPGDESSIYFYQPPEGRDSVRVRSNLLYGLTVAAVISAPTLEAFRAAGFLFEHAIRCYMPSEEVERYRRSADREIPSLPGKAEHLRPLLCEAQRVWVMGRIARKAVGNVAEDFPRERNQISKPPYPCRLKGTKYFVSRYLSRMSRSRAATICCVLRDSFPKLVAPDVGDVRCRSEKEKPSFP
jgi:hypothetical protein